MAAAAQALGNKVAQPRPTAFDCSPVSTCGSCGTEVWEVDGAGRVISEWDEAAGQLVREHQPRVPGAGIVVTEANLGIFRVREFPGWSFCTDDVVRAIEEAKLTNAGFLEVGDQVAPTQ